jgi:hypothetical protein
MTCDPGWNGSSVRGPPPRTRRGCRRSGAAARRHRQRQVAGAVLAAVLLFGLGPGQGLARRVGGAGPVAPLTRPPSGVATPPSSRAPINHWIDHEGRPVAPVVLVTRGVFEGRYWEYLAYRTDRGRVCGQWHDPDEVERTRRTLPHLVVEVDGRWLYPGGGCGLVFGTIGFRDRNRTAHRLRGILPGAVCPSTWNRTVRSSCWSS